MSSFVNKCNFVLLRPYFDAINKAECETFRKKCIELSQNEEGSQYYGFTVNSDETKFFCREAYNTVADVQKHIDNVGATIGEFLGGGHAKITVIYVHATAEQIKELKEMFVPLNMNAVYMVIDESVGFNCQIEQDKSYKGDFNFCVIEPTFKIKSKENVGKIKELMTKMVDASKDEKNALYYGFAWDEESESFFCQEAYASGDAILEHLGNVTELVKQALEYADLTAFLIHGPTVEQAKYRDAVKDFNCEHFNVGDGFCKLKLTTK